MRSNKIRISLATLTATIGLLAAFAPGASAWHGEFHGHTTDHGPGRIFFEIGAQPGWSVGIVHLLYHGGDCGRLQPGIMPVLTGEDAIRTASGTGSFSSRNHTQGIHLTVDLTHHGGHVSATGHFTLFGGPCVLQRINFTATAAGVVFP